MNRLLNDIDFKKGVKILDYCIDTNHLCLYQLLIFTNLRHPDISLLLIFIPIRMEKL